MWGNISGDDLKRLIEDTSIGFKNKNDWCQLWVGGFGDHHTGNEEKIVVFGKDESGYIRVWGSNTYKQAGIGYVPVTENYGGNQILKPTGTFFNFTMDGGECADNVCQCVKYQISNLSIYPMYCEYTTCLGVKTNITIAGSGIRNPQPTVICACKDSFIIKENTIESLISVIMLGEC